MWVLPRRVPRGFGEFGAMAINDLLRARRREGVAVCTVANYLAYGGSISMST